MDFGVSLLGLVQQPRDVDMRQSVEDVLTWVRTAEEVGFSYVVSGQHYLTDPFQELQPVPLLARLISETTSLRLVSTLIVPLQNPVDLAETWATLDILSGGRMGLSLALGYRDEEYDAFGVDRSKRVKIFTETIDTLRALWTEEEVTVDGEMFRLDGATCTIRPLQQPHIPLWIAANADVAVQRAARMGLPWNINPHSRFSTIERQVGLYREAAREAGRPFTGLPVHRELFCAPTREEAYETAGPYLARKYAAYDRWGQDTALPGDEDFDIPFEELIADRFILGDPDDCARELERYVGLGVDHVHMRMNWPGMPLEPALDGLRLFGREVIPRFADR